MSLQVLNMKLKKAKKKLQVFAFSGINFLYIRHVRHSLYRQNQFGLSVSLQYMQLDKEHCVQLHSVLTQTECFHWSAGVIFSNLYKICAKGRGKVLLLGFKSQFLTMCSWAVT